jgi:hypothetical protein
MHLHEEIKEHEAQYQDEQPSQDGHRMMMPTVGQITMLDLVALQAQTFGVASAACTPNTP